ncbi:MAG: Acylphosphate phosphohydrolase, putative [uncultured Thermomicrobiales bacterium]|uniref:Acylphosphatase n=1 Tax=uncultured Thermomicrobiales bacterium TaxID=1645740 RepID=A0A6J4TZZ6_9BACT|nr:MAG: Acylphosphate phosphohydrolase, putative [uncultured Thermomicrobiales bacterium]
MIELRRIRVEGMVQGVNFRAEARREARALGVNGFARNETDGSVLIEAEGEPAALDRFVAWCRHGRPPARVDRVAVEAGPPVGHVGFARR